MLFRAQLVEHEFVLAKDVKFTQTVKIDTQVKAPKMRFGINQDHINNFKKRLMEVEIEGRKFRTKYQIPMADGASQAENFLWTILGNKEAKEAGHRFRYHKPTAFHWQKFAEMATKAGVLKHIIQLAASQAMWQFVETLAVTKINKSTHQAKESAVMTLVYINVIRITIMLIMDGQKDQLFSLEFMNMMASIKARINTVII